jgi:hypothetical protein
LSQSIAGNIAASPIAFQRSHADQCVSHRNTHSLFFFSSFIPSSLCHIVCLSFRHDRRPPSRDCPRLSLPAVQPSASLDQIAHWALSVLSSVAQLPSPVGRPPVSASRLQIAALEPSRTRVGHLAAFWRNLPIRPTALDVPSTLDPDSADPCDSRISGEPSFGSHRSLQQSVASIGPTVGLVAAVAASRKISPASLQGSSCSHPATFQPGLRLILAIRTLPAPLDAASLLRPN